ncbi:peptidase C39 family protein, partial [Streptomyces sp. NPDC005921]
MSRSEKPSRRTVLAAAASVAAAAVAQGVVPAVPAAAAPETEAEETGRADTRPIEYRSWTTYSDWKTGTAKGTGAVAGDRPGVVIGTPAGTTTYTDPHTGTKATWEYATWTGPVQQLAVPATETIASWNADTPAGTWIQVELHGTYSDGTQTPWYVMGRWAAGDQDIKRTSVDGQSDGKSTIWTDTFAIDDATTGLRLTSYQLRLTLYRKPGTKLTPTVWRLGAMGSDIPDRFTVPASTPGLAQELKVPRYSQEIHKGQYPEYDNGGEAWCSPTSDR